MISTNLALTLSFELSGATSFEKHFSVQQLLLSYYHYINSVIYEKIFLDYSLF